MSRSTVFSLAAVTLLAVAPAALEAQKASRPLDTRNAMPSSVTSGFGASNRNNEIKPVSIGTRHSSSIDDSDDALNTGHKIELWAMELRSGEQVVVTVRSTSFDTRVAAFDPENTSNSAENDDFETTSTNSQVTFRAGRSGVFGILVAPYDAAERGSYTLEVVRAGSDEQLASAPVKAVPMSKRGR
jgi:hypothetical protein